MGSWVNRKWFWNLKWRISLFAWVEELVGDLITAVNHTVLSENISDVRVWSFHKSNVFSVSNFVFQVNHLMGDGLSKRNPMRLVWQNVAPPRAQIHVWFVLQGKLNTRERLLDLVLLELRMIFAPYARKGSNQFHTLSSHASSRVVFGTFIVSAGISISASRRAKVVLP